MSNSTDSSKRQRPIDRYRFSASIDTLLKNLSNTGRGRKQAFSIAIDAGIVVVSLWLAYSLRHGMLFSDIRHTWYLFLLLPLLTAGIFSGLGVYRWVIRSTNQRLFRQLAKGAALSALALLVVMFLIPPDRSNPRSVFLIYGLLLTFGVVGVRVVWQGLFHTGEKGEPVAVYGAGSAGQQLVNLLSVGGEFRPVVFIDDDRSLEGSLLSDLPVFYGANPQLKSELIKFDVNSVVLAMPSLSSADYQSKLKAVDSLGLPVLTMPSVAEIMSGKARADDIRDVSINDILGRSEVKPDLDLMCKRVTGKTVLVTGGGGSIGSELCRQVMALAPKHLLILDNCEANLYHITEEFNCTEKVSLETLSPAFTPVLGSVTDTLRINGLMEKYDVDTVYHAAAYKHVPIVESQPDQGVEVNVFGTLTVLNAAIEHGVSDFVLISTDKAVRPTNAMGATKRVAELVLQAKAQLTVATRISMVRFGNVLGSSGSVVPKFKKQIKAGGPITLTHKDITRYFMTIPEAAQLVLQASAIAKGGDVFVLDMGEPVRIEQLAKTMVRLYGRRLVSDTGNPEDIAIQVEGLRPGEKMFEELFITDECVQTEVPKISTAKESWVQWSVLSEHIAALLKAIRQQDQDTLRSIIMELAFTGHNTDELKQDGEASFGIENEISNKSAVGKTDTSFVKRSDVERSAVL